MDDNVLLTRPCDGDWITVSGLRVKITVTKSGCSVALVEGNFVSWNVLGVLTNGDRLPRSFAQRAAQLMAPIDRWLPWSRGASPSAALGQCVIDWRYYYEECHDERLRRHRVGLAAFAPWDDINAIRIIGRRERYRRERRQVVVVTPHAPVAVDRAAASGALRGGARVREALEAAARAIVKKAVVTRVAPFPDVTPRAPGAWPPPSHRWRYRPGFPEAS